VAVSKPADGRGKTARRYRDEACVRGTACQDTTGNKVPFGRSVAVFSVTAWVK